jgi:hypothetical protein
MPKITKSYCDICGDETDGCTEIDIHAGEASTISVEHTISINLKVERHGPVNSISEPVGLMPSDEICINCYYTILYNHIKGRAG